MTEKLSRRTVLLGSGAVVVAGAAAFGTLRAIGMRAPSPEAAAAAYAALLADVHDDYVNGRVVEHMGWVLSQHEFDTIDARHSEATEAATVS
jgi:hypothetical protein